MVKNIFVQMNHCFKISLQIDAKSVISLISCTSNILNLYNVVDIFRYLILNILRIIQKIYSEMIYNEIYHLYY